MVGIELKKDLLIKEISMVLNLGITFQLKPS